MWPNLFDPGQKKCMPRVLIFKNLEGQMAPVICPLAVDWGNFADWAAVFVGLAAAISTIAIAILAHKTSEKATDIAKYAAEIAQQQHNEGVQLREASARIVGRLLAHELSELPIGLFAIHKRVDEQFLKKDRYNKKFGSLKISLIEATNSLLPGAEAVIDRIHALPDMLGDNLATLIGYSRSLNETSKQMLRKMTVTKYGDDIYIGNADRDVAAFMSYVEIFSRQAILLANEIRIFIGEDAYDYSDYELSR